MSLDKLKKAKQVIVDFFKDTDRATYGDLELLLEENNLVEKRDKETATADNPKLRNVIYWTTKNLILLDAISELNKEGILITLKGKASDYQVQGQGMNLPLMIEQRHYDTPHWCPIVFEINKEKTATGIIQKFDPAKENPISFLTKILVKQENWIFVWLKNDSENSKKISQLQNTFFPSVDGKLNPGFELISQDGFNIAFFNKKNLSKENVVTVIGQLPTDLTPMFYLTPPNSDDITPIQTWLNNEIKKEAAKMNAQKRAEDTDVN